MKRRHAEALMLAVFFLMVGDFLVLADFLGPFDRLILVEFLVSVDDLVLMANLLGVLGLRALRSSFTMLAGEDLGG